MVEDEDLVGPYVNEEGGIRNMVGRIMDTIDAAETKKEAPVKNIDVNPQPHYSSSKLLERLTSYDSCKNFDKQRQIYSAIQRQQLEEHSLAWQDKHITQASKLAYLYESQLNSDVVFEVEGQRITAHRFLLSVCSPVFEAMFSEKWSSEQVIVITDMEVEPFRKMLQFAYTDAADLRDDIVMHVLYAARKYQIIALEYLCVEFLGENLLPSNALMLLDQATKFGISLLADMCFEVIDQSTENVLISDGFLDVSKESLQAIVSRGTLKVEELTLFHSVMRWARNQAEQSSLEQTPENLKSILGSIVKNIRYPLMTIEQFAESVVPTKILEDSEFVDIYSHFALKSNDYQTKFCCESRVVVEEFTINRFQRIESRWGYNGTPDRIKFQVDHLVYLKGFGLFGSMNMEHVYAVTIEVIKANDGISVAKAETEMSTTGKAETFKVFFNEAVEIEPNVVYVASVTVVGLDSYYGSKGLRQMIKQTKEKLITIRFTYAQGNNNGTSVDDGQIPEFIFYIKR